MSMYPVKAAAVSTAAGLLLWLIGFATWAIILFCFLGFLGMGGLQFFRIVYRTFPHDLWMAKTVVKLISLLRKGVTNKMYVSDYFQETVKKNPNKVAILYENTKLTFQEVDELSNRIANALRTSTPLQHGDTMAVFMENCPEYVLTSLALSKLGVTAAFLNYNLRGDSLAHCIRIANCSGMIFASSFADAVSDILPNLAISEMLYFVGDECSLPQAKSLNAAMKEASPSNPPPVAGKSSLDKMCYIYSSGTTGLPKACKMRHNRFYGISKAMGVFGNATPEDVVYITLPLYHTNGGVLGLGQMLFSGCTVAIRKKFSASNFWSDCIKYQCTICFYIGEVCRYILAQPKKPVDTQHCIRIMIGNGLRVQIWTEFVRRFQIPRILEFYGSTEGNVGMVNPFNKVGACGVGSVLLPFINPVCLVKVDPDTGDYVRNGSGFCVEAGVNEPGEVFGRIRKEIISTHFEGYSDPKASEKKVMSDVFAPGDQYFMSGDILRKDEDGFMYFCDRTGDTFRWKGENVSTTEVEAIMANILQLRDVVVYGVEVAGNEGRAGMAAIVGTSDSVDLSGLAQQLFLSLPTYAVPVFVRMIGSVDLTGTFKLKKVKLRKEGFDLTALSDPLFVLDASRKAYLPLTEEVYEKLQSGTIRV